MGKRISLREFQQSLVERLTSAQRGEASSALLGVRSGPDYWLLDLPDAGEIIPLPALTPVPLTRPWFRGLANVRGTLYTVADLAAFHGFDPTPMGSDARLLLANNRFGFSSALVVTRAMGLRNPEQFEPRSSDPDSRRWVGETLSDNQGITWKRLLIRKLFAAPEFLEISI